MAASRNRKEQVKDEILSHRVIGAAIEAHRHLGPGLLESAYQTCLAYELGLQSIPFELQVDLPVRYKGADLDCRYRMDLVVEIGRASCRERVCVPV